jgi:hypothetical protein
MSRRTKSRIAAAGTLAFLGIAPSARAVDYFWNNAGVGNWNDPANWTNNTTPNTIPGAGDPGFINNGGTAVIDSSMNLTAGFAIMGRTTGESGTLQMTGGSLATGSDVRVGGNSGTGGGTGRLDQSGGAITLNGGNLNVGFGSAGGGAVGVYDLSGGSLQVSSGFIAAVGNRGNGTINQTGGTLYVRGGTSAATAEIQLGRNIAAGTGSGLYNLSGGVAAAAQLRFGGANSTNTASINTFNLSGTGKLITNTISVVNTGATNTFNFTGGTLSVANVNIPLVNNGGTLNPGGANFAAAPADISGLVETVIGTTTFGGNNSYTQGPAGILGIDIAAPATNDLVDIGLGTNTGSANLAGTIAVNLLNNFDPALGSTFDVLTADSIVNAAVPTGLTPGGHLFLPSIEIGGDGRQVLRLTVAEVPEPAAFTLLGIAGLTLTTRRPRRKQSH